MEKPFNILLVDDEQDFRDPIVFWLEAKGYTVRMAGNGQDAIKLLEEEMPNIILLDINMPVMNGIDTLRHIRDKYNSLPVIMITAEPEKLSIIQELGISGFFPKSGSLSDLERLLEPLIRIHVRMSSAE